MKRGGRLLLLTTTAALVAGACGGSNNSSNAIEPPDSVSVEQMQDLAESGAIDEIAQASGVPEACLEITMAMAAATGGMIPGSEASPTDIGAIERSFDAVKDMAPDDLVGDIETVKNGMAEYLSVFAEYGNDIEAMMADPGALERMSSVFDDENFSAAAERFSSWMETICNP